MTENLKPNPVYDRWFNIINRINQAELLHTRKLIKRLAEEEDEDVHSVWSIYGSGVDLYQRTFSDVFKGSLKDTLLDRKGVGKTAFALDLMGEGQALRSLPIDGGLAVTLNDLRTSKKRSQDDQKNIELISGDILSKKTWSKVSLWLDSHHPEGFDIILCRPQKALWYFRPIFSQIEYYLFQQVWERLNNDGMFLTEILWQDELPEEAWVNVLNHYPSITTHYRHNHLGNIVLPTLSIIKHADAPSFSDMVLEFRNQLRKAADRVIDRLERT